MLRIAVILSLVATCATGVHAQRPDSTARRDSTARADSVARADSIALVRELERAQGAATPPAAPTQPSQGGPTNPRLLPDISVIGDVVGDFTPDESTQESGRRVDIREVELALGAAVDPYFRADVILGLSDVEGIAIEESYITATALPGGLQGRLGRFHMPVGKQNTTHRGELQTVEYPYVIQRFLGEEAAKGTGLWLSQIFSPLGFYQELQVTAVDHFGEDEGGFVTLRPANRSLGGMGFSGRLRNYVDISQSTNIEVSGSAATGRLAQPIVCDGIAICDGFEGAPATVARQSVVGADVTLRWRPLQQGLYRSFILQAEVMRQLNERAPALPVVSGTTVAYAGPARDFDGAYVFARYQLGRRRYVGARFDWVQDPLYGGQTFKAASGYLQFFPTEFSKFVLAYERAMPPAGAKGLNRILFQSTFAVGPHRPHPF